MQRHPHVHLPPVEEGPTLGDEMEQWLAGDDVSLGALIHLFGPRSFALAFVLLMAPSALPLPTGGVTHVLEVATMVLAAQVVFGRGEPWIPARWQGIRLAGDGSGKAVRGLLRLIRRAERFARPRATILFGNHVGNVGFGLLVILGALGAFLAPPFTGLDTLPALGVVVLSLGVLFRDVIIAAVGVVVMLVGITLMIIFGRAIIEVAGSLWPF
jgi:hypothetical protein